MEPRKRRISGPGASDFLGAPGGADIPGASPSKGETEVDRDAPLTEPGHLEPDLTDDADATPHQRERGTPRGRQ